MPQPTEPICLTPECGKPSKYKGICPSCYGVARKLIDRGETSWDQLYLLGLVELELKPFEKAFREKIKQQAPADGET